MKKLHIAAVLGLLSAMSVAHAGDINVIRINAPVDPYLGKWLASTPTYGPWQPTSAVYSCGAWAPLSNSVTKGASFVQTANCSQDFQRLVAMTEVNNATGAKRNTGVTQTEVKTDSAKTTRQAVGTRDCAYTANNTFWQTYRYTREFTEYIAINGSFTYTGSYDTPMMDTVVINGVSYYRGALRDSRYDGAYHLQYEVCRAN